MFGFARLPDWSNGWGAGGGVNSSGYTNLVCGPAKGSHTSDPKKSFKRVLLKGIHTVFFGRSVRQSARSRNFGLGFRIFGFGGRAGTRADLGSGGDASLPDCDLNKTQTFRAEG